MPTLCEKIVPSLWREAADTNRDQLRACSAVSDVVQSDGIQMGSFSFVVKCMGVFEHLDHLIYHVQDSLLE